jgi:8-oxo-dGTP diphosphatase
MARPVLVSVVLFSLQDEALQVLLAVSAGTLSLPAASPRQDEALEETANRLIAGLIHRGETYLEQLHTYGEAGRPVRVVYIALVPAGALPALSSEMRWIPAASPFSLAAGESEVLEYALRRLRHKLEYGTVGFHLLPGEFTLSELQRMYEVVLGERLDKRNFRRRILQSGVIEKTALIRSGEGRPARLYRCRPEAIAEFRARRLFP